MVVHAMIIDDAELAIANVLKRYRSEHLKASLQMSLYIEKHQTPPRGLGSELDALGRQIRLLEAVIAEIRSPSDHG